MRWALLRNITNDHACASHMHDPRAVQRRRELEGESAPENAFDRVRLGQARQQRVMRQAALDERAVEAARVKEREATLAREAAEAKAAASKAAAAEQIDGPPLNITQPVRPARAAAQAGRQAIRNILHVVRAPVAPPPTLRFEIPPSEENKVLLHCCR